MTERFASDLVFILVILIIAALLGFLIGYLIQKYKYDKKCRELEGEIARLKSEADKCLQEKNFIKAELKEKFGVPFSATAAAEIFGRKITENDLALVEGIGEKIESILKSHGIDTWYKLSRITDIEIKEILLAKGGPGYNIHDPKTWPVQALLACEGQWARLKQYQEELLAGK
jgi:predicted flap endonuclease-1-like 5' DNA nuclease